MLNKGICEKPDRSKIHRIRMDSDLITHFLGYLFDSGSGAANGTNPFVFENGSKVLVPKAVLTGVRYRICSSYIGFCEATNTSHLGLSSLLKIMNTIKPASRTQLSGVDNVLVEAENAIQELAKIARKTAPHYEELIKKLRKVVIVQLARYLIVKMMFLLGNVIYSTPNDISTATMLSTYCMKLNRF